ncbi:hypothetical protein B0A52_02383 [Exophiala mesophila]|uniref:Uncharacterized protein n=1 Tax=Exophiala mesophila TaxID=212818 RepID=A0A438NBU9_EXOME|nr:hypothetical protein B0A52_02383 [Exophiala mesophila]
MGKTRTKTHSKSGKDILHSTTSPLVKSARTKASSRSIEDLLTEAAALLEQSQPELALPLAEEALRRLEAESDHNNDIDTLLQLAAQGQPTLPIILNVYGEIQLSLGNLETARQSFLRSTQIDPDGALISAEPYLWLAQLSEPGGRDSIEYFVKATEVLRNEIDVLSDTNEGSAAGGTAALAPEIEAVVGEKRAKLAEALCAMAEVYMTDLSWEEDAESRCEAYVTEAVAVCPEPLSAGALQTLASVRISQERLDDARQALKRSLEIWKDIPVEVESESRPDFATRVSLSRLLMEVEVETDAMRVIEELIREDDQSVECWYLGGWCQVLMSNKDQETRSAEEQTKLLEQAKSWLDSCLRLYRVQEYEDERLRDHAKELVHDLNTRLGVEDGGEEDDDDAAWEDEDDDGSDDDLEVRSDDGDVKMS